MNIYTRCKKCKNDLSFLSLSDSRADLAAVRGQKFKLRCVICNSEEYYHVRDLRAEPHKRILLVLFILAIFLCAIAAVVVFELPWRYTSSLPIEIISIVAAPFFLYLALSRWQEEKAKRFNKS